MMKIWIPKIEGGGGRSFLWKKSIQTFWNIQFTSYNQIIQLSSVYGACDPLHGFLVFQYSSWWSWSFSYCLDIPPLVVLNNSRTTDFLGQFSQVGYQNHTTCFHNILETLWCKHIKNLVTLVQFVDIFSTSYTCMGPTKGMPLFFL
jgi:hypothetical protein